MESFPPEIHVATLFPEPSKNPELARIREAIVCQIKKYISIFHQVALSEGSPPNADRQKIMIHLNGMGLNYRCLLAIHSELIQRGFIIHFVVYENMDNNGIWQTTKQILFEELDPFGSMPVSMVLSSPLKK